MRSTSSLRQTLREGLQDDDSDSEQDSVLSLSESSSSEDEMYRRARASLLNDSSTALLSALPSTTSSSSRWGNANQGNSRRRLTGSRFAATRPLQPALESEAYLTWANRVRTLTGSRIDQISDLLDWYKYEHFSLTCIEGSPESRQTRHEVEDIIIKLSDTLGDIVYSFKKTRYPGSLSPPFTSRWRDFRDLTGRERVLDGRTRSSVGVIGAGVQQDARDSS